MSRIGKKICVWAACGLAAFASLQSAPAALIVDMQAVNATGATLVNNKTITNATVGAVISFNIVAQITGANGSTTDDGLTSLAGGFYTQNGGPLRANVANVLLNSAFTGSGSSIGAPNNGLALGDTDGDIDWGGTTTGAADWFAVRGLSGTVSGTSHLIGTLQLQVTSISAGEITFNFVPRPSNTAANWLQDGATVNPSTAGTGGFVAGTAVTISAVSAVPEPGTLALGGMLVAGLAGWQLRRKKA